MEVIFHIFYVNFEIVGKVICPASKSHGFSKDSPGILDEVGKLCIFFDNFDNLRQFLTIFIIEKTVLELF